MSKEKSKKAKKAKREMRKLRGGRRGRKKNIGIGELCSYLCLCVSYHH